MIVCFCFLTGCNREAHKVAAPLRDAVRHERVAGPARIDAGILFTDHVSSLCRQLSLLGIPAGEVVSLDSSCECVVPELVSYQSSAGGATSEALLLHLDGSGGPGIGEGPANLGVVIHAGLDSGKTSEIEVSLLLVSQANAEKVE